MKAQIVYLTNGTKLHIKTESNYDRLALVAEQGVLVWKLDGNSIPHSNVLAIIDGEMPEEKLETEKE